MKRAEQLEKTRQAILKTATKLFLQKGFGETSTRDIAKQIGITQPALVALPAIIAATRERAAPAPMGMRKRPLMPKNWTLRSRERYDFISMAVPPT